MQRAELLRRPAADRGAYAWWPGRALTTWSRPPPNMRLLTCENAAGWWVYLFGSVMSVSHSNVYKRTAPGPHRRAGTRLPRGGPWPCLYELRECAGAQVSVPRRRTDQLTARRVASRARFAEVWLWTARTIRRHRRPPATQSASHRPRLQRLVRFVRACGVRCGVQ